MSYQRPRWVSVHNYNRLRNVIGVSGAAKPESSSMVLVTKTVVVSGMVSTNPESGAIDPLLVKDTNGTIELPVAGSYSIRFEDSSGQPLGAHAFELEKDSDGMKGPFSLVLPWNPDTKRIVLLHNNQPIASREASANPPTVTVTSPNGGETLNGATATFTWTAADLDGNSLTYAIDYSSDAGVTWSSVVSGWASTSYIADLQTFAGGSQSLIRVTATDGFISTADQSKRAVHSVATCPAGNDSIAAE